MSNRELHGHPVSIWEALMQVFSYVPRVMSDIRIVLFLFLWRESALSTVIS